MFVQIDETKYATRKLSFVTVLYPYVPWVTRDEGGRIHFREYVQVLQDRDLWSNEEEVTSTHENWTSLVL